MTGTPAGTRTNNSVLAASGIRPEQREKLPPCSGGCVSGADIRGWIGVVAQRQKLGFTDQEAYREAWNILAAVNPFPATMGRVCPHPCEAHCNRKEKDGPVAINALERFLGDWALAAQVPLPRLQPRGSRLESIGVIGSGPAGLSFAYQMARRGYGVTMYEREEKPGGMLQYGIPQYRLPEEVIASEVERVLDVGVELRLKTAVGRDISPAELRTRHQVVFIGIGAGQGLTLGLPGEEGVGTWTGTEYLSLVNQGKPVELGARVVVVGGGNTAVDAARTARRTGAEVTILYRRTRTEMPALEGEIEDALTEGVRIVFLASPIEIQREKGMIRSVSVQHMVLGEPDSSGRRASLPVSGSTYVVETDSVISAVSQRPDWDVLGELSPGTTWLRAAPADEYKEGLWAGGDLTGLGVAGSAISQGRQAAEAVDARLRGVPVPAVAQRDPVSSDMVKSDFYPESHPVVPPERPSEQWLEYPDEEPRGTITEEEFLREVSRCFSCGLCYGCEQCFMFCNAEGLVKLKHTRPGRYFVVGLDLCQACGKCVDLCPCGFLSPC